MTRNAGRGTRRLFVAVATLIAATTGCKVTLLDSYNKDAEEGLLRTYARVESLFDALAEADSMPGGRPYARFAARYAEINEAIRVQVLRESARPLNAESYGIIATIDTVFSGYRDAHRKADGVANVLIGRHRDNMRRLFGAALRAERVKKDEGNP